MSETAAPPVDPANEQMAAGWNAGDGEHWVRHAVRYDGSLAVHHGRLLDAAAIRSGERVLDIGCGSGQTSRDAARLADPGEVLGVDISGPLVANARRLAGEEGVGNVTFVQADAQIHPFDPETFDLAMSRTGVMFFGDPVAAFANVARAVRPGGRLAMLVWQRMADNEWFSQFAAALTGGQGLPTPPPGAPGPFSLGDPDRVHALLEPAGFAEVRLDDVRAPMHFGGTADEAFDFLSSLGFAQALLREMDEPGREQALAALRASIEAHQTSDGIRYGSAAWLVTAVRDPGR